MTPYSLNPPEGPSIQGQTQLFISPNNQECPTFLNIFDPRQNIEIGGSFTENYQQDELHDGSSSNCNSSSLVPPEPVQEVMDADPCDEERYKIEEERKNDSTNNIHGCEGNKWMSSKMRLMKKMMRPSVSPTTDKMAINSSPRFQNQGLQTCKYSQRSPRNNGSATIRVCSDCNTSTTPLWRSGPKGPKSLCNACGIRQRKARRAMAEAANGLVTPINNVAAACAKTRVHNKEKKSRTNHFAKFKNKYKSVTTTTTSTDSSESHVRKLDYLKDFAISLRSTNSDFEQVMFPRDEVAEAALLLMDLSCGFLSTYN